MIQHKQNSNFFNVDDEIYNLYFASLYLNHEESLSLINCFLFQGEISVKMNS